MEANAGTVSGIVIKATQREKYAKSETTFCVGVLKEDDCKGIPEKNNKDPERD